MYPQVVFDGPLHQSITSPTDDDLRRIVYETDDAYWLAGSGEGELVFRIDGSTAYLGLKKLRPLGFRLFYSSGPNSDMLVALSGESLDETVDVFSGGSTYREPVAFFFDEDATLAIIQDFCTTGRPPANAMWRRWVDLDWPGRFDEE